MYVITLIAVTIIKISRLLSETSLTHVFKEIFETLFEPHNFLRCPGHCYSCFGFSHFRAATPDIMRQLGRLSFFGHDNYKYQQGHPILGPSGGTCLYLFLTTHNCQSKSFSSLALNSHDKYL